MLLLLELRLFQSVLFFYSRTLFLVFLTLEFSSFPVGLLLLIYGRQCEVVITFYYFVLFSLVGGLFFVLGLGFLGFEGG